MTPANYRVRIRQDGAGDRRLFESASANESAGLRDALTHLLRDEATEVTLAEMVRETDGPEGVARLFYWLTRLQQAGQLQYSLRLSDASDVQALPQHPGRVFHDVGFAASKTYVASRFAFIRRDDRDMQLESPLQPVALRFRSWLPGAVMMMFGQPASAQSIAERLPAASATDVVRLVEMFAVTGFIEEPRAVGESAAALWDFHELLFHARSSTPRLGRPFAGMNPHRQPEPPPVRPVFSNSEPITLPQPRLEQWMNEDPPLARVIEHRRSAASAGSNRLTLTHLSDFLYRTAHTQTGQHRALPSAGARHELEWYVAVHDVDALTPGFYHYHAPAHLLHKLRVPGDLVQEMLGRATAAWSSGDHTPHLLIVVAARFPRMASRYASIAYRNTLLDAGIAIEAMYLNATAMRLAPCALGINLPDLFARITGLDPFDETPVAMFVLSGSSE